MRGRWLFLLFLLGLLALVASTLFLIFFSCPFLSSCLNLLLTVRLEGSAPLVVAEDPSYLTSCRGFLFLLDVSSSGLQASWACFFFRGPLAPASLDLACVRTKCKNQV